MKGIRDLDIPINDDTFGMIHGDMHEGNFLVDPAENYKITYFDWDLLSRGHYSIDIGTFLMGLRFGTLIKKIPIEEANAAVKALLKTYLKGYSPDRDIPMKEIAEGAFFRIELIKVAFEFIVE